MNRAGDAVADALSLLALFGPTSSGKTGLSIELSLRLRDELGIETAVISADSRQVYRYMDIGTSKTRREQMRGVPHEMIDVTEPVAKLELEDYVQRARHRIEAQREQGRLPFVVGGTGVYVSALVAGWDVAGTADVRADLVRDFPRAAAADAHALLRRLDRAAASRVHQNNYEAIINALVVRMAQPGDSRRSGAPPVVLGLDPGHKALSRSIARTLDAQFAAGLHDEVVALAARYRLDAESQRRGRPGDNQVLRTHGYREFFAAAGRRGKRVSALDARELTTIRSDINDHVLAYSRRQRSWFDKLPGVRMVASADEALTVVRKALAQRRAPG